MPFDARLNVGSISDAKLLECHYSLTRQTEYMGRPSEDVRGGRIQLSWETSKDNSFAEWAVDPFALQSGSIEFKDSATGGLLKKVDFKDAYVVDYSESFHAADNQPMVQSVVLSARIIKIGDAEHKNPWPDFS